jgi:hypothetical protein
MKGVPVLVRGKNFTTELSLSSTNVVNFYTQTGRHPIFAAGNSASDRELLECALASDGPSLALLIEHDEVLTDFAAREGWLVVSMRNHWSTVLPKV